MRIRNPVLQAQRDLPVQRSGGEHAARLTRVHHPTHLGRGGQVRPTPQSIQPIIIMWIRNDLDPTD